MNTHISKVIHSAVAALHLCIPNTSKANTTNPLSTPRHLFALAEHSLAISNQSTPSKSSPAIGSSPSSLDEQQTRGKDFAINLGLTLSLIGLGWATLRKGSLKTICAQTVESYSHRANIAISADKYDDGRTARVRIAALTQAMKHIEKLPFTSRKERYLDILGVIHKALLDEHNANSDRESFYINSPLEELKLRTLFRVSGVSAIAAVSVIGLLPQHLAISLAVIGTFFFTNLAAIYRGNSLVNRVTSTEAVRGFYTKQ